VTVAVGAGGRLYFENQILTEKQLQASLADAATRSPEPLTLVIMADKGTTYDQLVHLAQLARQAGLRHALLATLPRLLDSPAQR
jgi:biopolymer transport protein ExbD